MEYKYKSPLVWKNKINVLTEKSQDVVKRSVRLDERIAELRNQQMKNLDQIQKINKEINHYSKLLDEFPFKDQIAAE